MAAAVLEQGTGLTLLADQTLMIGGYSNSFNLTSDYDGYILRVDAAGDTLWTRHVGTGSGLPYFTVRRDRRYGRIRRLFLWEWILVGTTLDRKGIIGWIHRLNAHPTHRRRVFCE